MSNTELLQTALRTKLANAYSPLHNVFGERPIDPKIVERHINDVRTIFEPTTKVLLELEAERKAVRGSTALSPDGKNKALADISRRAELEANTRMPKLRDAADAVAAAIDDAITLADTRLKLNPDQIVYRERKDDDASVLADRREFRDVIRQRFFGPNAPEKHENWRQQYRQLVIDDDEKARWAESDPGSQLVSASDREWARTYRVEHGAMRSAIFVLKAKQRTVALLVEFIGSEFKTPLL